MLPLDLQINELLSNYNFHVESPRNVFLKKNFEDPYFNIKSFLFKKDFPDIHNNIHDIVKCFFWEHTQCLNPSTYDDLVSIFLMSLLRPYIQCPKTTEKMITLEHTKEHFIWNNCLLFKPQIQPYTRIVLGRSSWVITPPIDNEENDYINIHPEVMRSIDRCFELYQLGLIPYGVYHLSPENYQKTLSMELLLGPTCIDVETALMID